MTTTTSHHEGGSKIKESSSLETLPPSSFSSSLQSKDNAQDTAVVIFSSQKSQFADYTTWKGIETKTGIEPEDALSFLLKELLDNALDYLESTQLQQHHDEQQPEIHVTVQKYHEKHIRITVCNSNHAHELADDGKSKPKTAFSKQMLKNIFDFDRYHSSKRNQFKITKGALGDALKEVLCIPHVLARDGQIADWNYPLYIIVFQELQQKLYRIQLIIDRINQTIRSKIEDSDSDFDFKTTAADIQQHGNSRHYNSTQVVLTVPIINDEEDNYAELLELYWFVSDYAMFTTHVKLTFEDKDNHLPHVEFPQLQNINSKWRNHTSIYYYNKKEFHDDFILGLDDNDSIVYDVLYNTFREGSNIRKSEITQMTIHQLKHSPVEIDRLYDELKNSMGPPTTLALPFDVTKKVRTKALEQRVSHIYGSFKEMKYRSATASYSAYDGTQIPFYFEIAIFHDVAGLQNRNLVFKQAINGSAIPDTGWTPFAGCEFEWTTKGSKYPYTSNSIYEIFAHFGYSHSKDRCRKPHSLIVVNLICPKIDYRSYGKSRIDFSPFAQHVAETTVLACMGGGRSSDGRPSKRRVLYEVLEDRKYKWSSLTEAQKLKHWWTQSDVFYATRKLLIETYHYSNEEIDRDYLTGLIKEVCEDDLGVKREDIGILAADRAQLYFKGKWMDVGLKEIEELSLYGIALLIIEKEGVAEQLRIFADQKGIAILNTRGFLTEYAEILSKKSEEEGCKVAILTDFDASGLVLARKAPDAYRIGIDFETLKDLGLDIEDVEEEYKPGTHLDPLKHDGKMYGIYPPEWIDYIATKRVEINSVTEELNDNQRFWDWIVFKLRANFTDWDYTRAVQIPQYVRPKALQSLNETLEKVGTATLKGPREKLSEKLSDIGPGLLFDRTDKAVRGHGLKTGKGDTIMTITKYEEAITEQSQHIIESDEILKPFLDKIEDLDNDLQRSCMQHNDEQQNRRGIIKNGK